MSVYPLVEQPDLPTATWPFENRSEPDLIVGPTRDRREVILRKSPGLIPSSGSAHTDRHSLSLSYMLGLDGVHYWTKTILDRRMTTPIPQLSPYRALVTWEGMHQPGPHWGESICVRKGYTNGKPLR